MEQHPNPVYDVADNLQPPGRGTEANGLIREGVGTVAARRSAGVSGVSPRQPARPSSPVKTLDKVRGGMSPRDVHAEWRSLCQSIADRLERTSPNAKETLDIPPTIPESRREGTDGSPVLRHLRKMPRLAEKYVAKMQDVLQQHLPAEPPAIEPPEMDSRVLAIWGKDAMPMHFPKKPGGPGLG